jgi:hypothetical protein
LPNRNGLESADIQLYGRTCLDICSATLNVIQAVATDARHDREFGAVCREHMVWTQSSITWRRQVILIDGEYFEERRSTRERKG